MSSVEITVVICTVTFMMLGWFVGNKIGTKHPKFYWLRWFGLIIGILLGLIGSIVLIISL